MFLTAFKRAKTRGQISCGVSYLLALVLHIRHNLLQRLLRLLRVIRPAVLKVADILPVLDHLLRHQVHVNGEAMTSGALPPRAAAPSTSDLVQPAGRVGALVAAEGKDERRDVGGLEGLEHLLGHDCGGHGGAGVGGNGVDEDVVLEALEGQGAREA